MNHNVTGKLQVTLLLAYIFRKKFCSLIFKASSEEIIVMYCEKLKAKSMKDGSGYSSWKKVSQTDEIVVFPFIWNSAVFDLSHVSLSELRC